MTAKEMLGKVDHTQLKAFATWEDIQKLCDEAIQYHTASVCVPPCYIKRIHDTYGDKINICTVVGFPLGYSVTEAKVAEVRKALEDGCNEIDMVVNRPDGCYSLPRVWPRHGRSTEKEPLHAVRGAAEPEIQPGRWYRRPAAGRAGQRPAHCRRAFVRFAPQRQQRPHLPARR